MQNFYEGSSVFITGATGFLGKSLIEKILRATPDVDTIFILIRPKRGQDVLVRLQQLLKSPVFDRLKEENAKVLEKVKPIVGDIGEEDLGISPTERLLLEEKVSIVIHSAATVKFNENLKTAINLNVRAPQRLIKLCKGMSNLKALVHVSTAYANCDQRNVSIQERVYPAPEGSMELLSNMDLMEETYLEENVTSLIGNKPNTYTYSKAIAECILQEEVTSAGIPACIVRPSMISAAWKEPVPGWVDGYSGPVGLSLAAASGLLKIVFGNADIPFDVVPIDKVVNMILTAAWQTSRNRHNVKVYNCCTWTRNPITLGRHITLIEHSLRHNSPLCRAVWYPQVTTTSIHSWHWIHCYLFHYLPACFLDLAAFCVSILSKMSHSLGMPRKESVKSRVSVVSIHNRVMAAAKAVKYFTVNGWEFESGNVDQLHDALKELPVSEQHEWSFDFAEYTWEDYMPQICHGVRKYLAKESDASLAVAKRRCQRLRLMKLLCDVILFAVILMVVGLLFRISVF